MKPLGIDPNKPLRIAIAGCRGRMGAALVRRAAADPAIQIVAGLTQPADPQRGQDVGTAAGIAPLGLPVSAQCEVDCDLLVEFTTPAGTLHWARWCADHGVRLVSGTTGLKEREHAALRAAAKQIPLLWSANMSIGVNLLRQLLQEVAQTLDEGWDIEIVETHHQHKLDHPSGTALALLEAVSKSAGNESSRAASWGHPPGSGVRKAGSIGVHSLRMGESIGEHTVHFASADELLTLQHRAGSRDAFASGTLLAARWLLDQPVGLYHMRDVLRDLGTGPKTGSSAG